MTVHAALEVKKQQQQQKQTDKNQTTNIAK